MDEQNASSLPDGMTTALRNTGIRRPKEGRWLGGVAAGIAARFDIDPVLVRVALVVLGVFFGLGVSVYLLAWALLPDENGQIALERAVRDHDAGAIVLSVLAALSLLTPLTGHDGGGWAVTLLAVGAVAAVWYVSTRRRRTVGSASQPVGWGSTPMTATGPSTSGGEAPMTNIADRPTTGAIPPASPPAAPGVAGAPPTAHRPGWQPPGPPGTPGAHPQEWQRPKRPPKPRRRGGGFALILVATGLSLIAFQVTKIAVSSAGVPGDHQAYGLAAVLAVLGLIVLGLGLAGWRTGLVGIAALVLAVGTVIAGVGTAGRISLNTGMGEEVWAPTSAAQLQQGYHVGTGSGVLDLRGLPANALKAKVINVDVGMGEMRVHLPMQGTAVVYPTVGVGDVQWSDGTGESHEIDGPTTGQDPITIGQGQPSFRINARVGMGSLEIERE